MSIKISKTILSSTWCETQALALIPHEIKHPMRALYAHGYTASKADCLPWAVRAAEAGIPTLIFDWPGHYLGGLNEVESFEVFKTHAHELFVTGFDQLEHFLPAARSVQKVILGGHSLGALLALKAMGLPRFAPLERLGIGVGIGLNNKVETHLFDTEFYQKTLNIRRQLVSPALDSSLMFPWIRDEKTRLQLHAERIHLIVGEDDMVVGAGGMEAFQHYLTGLGNHVTSFAPKKLAHHEPTLAAPHLHSFLKTELTLSP